MGILLCNMLTAGQCHTTVVSGLCRWRRRARATLWNHHAVLSLFWTVDRLVFAERRLVTCMSYGRVDWVSMFRVKASRPLLTELYLQKELAPAPLHEAIPTQVVAPWLLVCVQILSLKCIRSQEGNRMARTMQIINCPVYPSLIFFAHCYFWLYFSMRNSWGGGRIYAHILGHSLKATKNLQREEMRKIIYRILKKPKLPHNTIRTLL